MLTCVASSKPLGGPPADDVGAVSGAGTPRRLAMKALTTQIREMAIRASGAYRQCKPCSRAWERRECTESEGLESGNGTPASMSGRTEESASMIVDDDEQEEREWIAQVEPGVLITFVSGAGGGNDLKRIRFSREMFNKGQAQKWWAENHDKVLELYNVRSSNHPPPTLPGSEEESLKKEMVRPMTPSVRKERVPGNSNRAVMASSSASDDSQDHHHQHQQQVDSSGGLAGTPKLSVNSGTNKVIVGTSSSSSSSIKEEEEVVDGCGGGETSVSSNGSSSIDQEREWVEQDEPGVYLTIRAHPGGIRELRRVRFSRERFGEMLARMWWEENRGRIHQQYLFRA